MIKAPPTPKGFRDIDPKLAKKRRRVINTIIEVLESEGFEPLETPTVEFAETLKGKYGEEERLIYEFTDRGGRKLALRYDLTVPLARFIATNPNVAMPFRRYQVGQVFRGENPQRGRYREFTQLDFDIVGSSDIKEDAKIVVCTLKALGNLGLKNYSMRVSDRRIFENFNLSKKALIELDKIDKEGPIVFIKQLLSENISKNSADEIFNSISRAEKPQGIQELFTRLSGLGYKEGRNYDFWFDPTLARGLDYYTSFIFELRVESYGRLSVGGGGRYDNLIGMFAKREIPAVGFSFGLDRLIETLE